MKHSRAGFTIIEVILFVAVSGLLLVGAFVAMRVGIATTEFNDTTESTLSYFQRQYVEVATGVNVRDDVLTCNSAGNIVINTGTRVEPGASDCVILGRLFQFDPGLDSAANRITSLYLTSRVVNDLTGVSDIEAFGTDASRYRVRISTVDQLSSTYELPWSAVISQAQRHNSSPTATNIRSMAILRSPVSERMMVYGFSALNPGPGEFASTNNLISDDNSLALCMRSDEGVLAKEATLTVAPGQGQDLFAVNRGEEC